MPQFFLNDTPSSRTYRDLSDFAKGYVEAMFFTNEGVDAETYGEFYLNELGVSRLTKTAIASIAADCERFWNDNKVNLETAMELVPGSGGFRYAKEELDEQRLGNLFFFARQGHGIGFNDDGNAPCLKELQKAARDFKEAYPETWRGWIYHR